MTDNLSSGLPWVLIDIAGVLVLAIAAIYGIYVWRQRRKARELGSAARAPGPAPKGAPPSADDRRAA